MSPGQQQQTLILRYFPLYFLALWAFISYLVSWVGGWHLLAQRFRADSEFDGTLIRWSYATMRWGVHYNGALKIGANAEGLYIASIFLLRMGHPPLYIPWTEVGVEQSPWWAMYLSVTLILGKEQQIPFRISRSTARKLRIASATAWPDAQNSLQL